jgi:hypothetical protein
MSEKFNATIAVIGIDIGRNSSRPNLAARLWVHALATSTNRDAAEEGSSGDAGRLTAQRIAEASADMTN